MPPCAEICCHLGWEHHGDKLMVTHPGHLSSYPSHPPCWFQASRIRAVPAKGHCCPQVPSLGLTPSSAWTAVPSQGQTATTCHY